MNMTPKAMNSPVGLRVTFETAPVEKFHVNALLPDPSDAYRIDVTVTMPESKSEKWLEGAAAAIRRVQNGMRWTIRLNYENVSQFFNLDQLRWLNARNADYSMHLYGVPQEKIDEMGKPLIKEISAAEFARMYGKASRDRRKEISP